MKYGNYSEDEIIKNLNRNKTRIKKIKKKKDNEEIKKENQPDLDDNGMISTTNPITGESDTKIKTKKRKFGDNISLTFSQSMNKENILSYYSIYYYSVKKSIIFYNLSANCASYFDSSSNLQKILSIL